MVHRRRSGAFALSVLVSFTAGCSIDLSVPPPPTAGSVSGALDVGTHGSAVGHELKLYAEDGSYRSTRSQAGGVFVFGDVKPGFYFLEGRVPGFEPLVRPNVRVLNGAVVDLGTFTLVWAPSDRTVRGLVTAPRGGTLVGGRVDLLLEPALDNVSSVPIDEQGAFVARVPPGIYTLRAAHPLYVSATLEHQEVAGEVLDLSAEPLALGLNPARLGGTVLKERDGQAAVPAVGASVTLDTGDTTVTDVDGNFLLTGLPAGAHTVRLGLMNWHDPVTSHPVTLQPGALATLDPVTLALDRGAIDGTVTLADGQPARDIVVSLTGTTYSTTAVQKPSAPSSAEFRLANVPVGTYELIAHQQGYQPGVVGSVRVNYLQTTTIASLTLVVQSGAFVIDDGDPLSTPGYTRVRGVTLQLTSTSAAKYRASQDSTFAGVAFAPLTGSSQPFTLTGGEGTKVISVQFQDALGVDGPVLRSSIVYDVTAPSSPSLLLNGGEAFTRVAQPLFATVQALDLPATGVDVSSGLRSIRLTDNGPPDAQGLLQVAPQPYLRDLLFLRPSVGEGVQRVYAQFFDHAGNASAIVPAAITVDVTTPAGALTIGQGARATLPGYTNQPLVDLRQQVDPEPDGGFVLIKLGNSQAELNTAVYQPVRGISGWFLDASGDGAKTVLAVLRDAAGNTSGNLTATITYDTTPPSPVGLTLVGAAVTRAASVTLEATATDSNALSPTEALTVSEDPLFVGGGQVGPQALPNPQPVSVTFPLSGGDGAKRIYARFRDAAGNDATTQVTLTRDTEAPTGSITVRGTLADGTTSTATTSTDTVSVLLTQRGASEYVIGDEGLLACPTTGYAALPPNGLIAPHTLTGGASPREVRVCLRDPAGNVSELLSATIVLDTTAPPNCRLSLTGSRADGQPTPALPTGKTGSPFVSATVNDCTELPTEFVLSTSALTCSASAALNWQLFYATSAVTLTGGDGLNTVYGCVRDAARNTAAIVSAALTLDTTAPRVTAFSLAGGAAYFNQADYQDAGSTLDVAALASASGANEWSVSEGATFTTFVPFASNTKVMVRLGGTGVRTVSALLRDDVGNEAPVVSDSIEVDIAPPSGGTLSVLSPTGNSFTNSVSVTTALTAPADATVVQLASAAGASCVASDFTGAISRSMAPNFGFVLPAGDGAKRVCARLFDLAGNVGAPFQATITLDTLPPTAPQLSTTSRYVNSANGTPLVVTTNGPVTELHFANYQRLGGLSGGAPLSSWVDDAAAIDTTSFTYTLQANAAVEELPNVLRLRARDLAGNVSPEATVVITTDIKAPAPVQLDPRWVRNGSERGTLFWNKSSSSDVVGYNVYYAPGTQQPGYLLTDYRGTSAQQGNSPVRVGDVGSATLSGLSNGSSTFVTVRPVDRAGNEGPAPTSPSPVEVQLQPNVVSPDLLGSVTTAIRDIARLQRFGHYAYAWGLASSGTVTVLQPMDLSTIESPVQYGGLTTTPALPTMLAEQIFADDAASIPYAARGLDLAIEGQYLFATSGKYVRIFSLRDPRVPTLVSAIDVSSLTPAAFAVAVKGDTLFVGGSTADDHGLLMAFDLATLFDTSAATVPTLTNLLGAVQGSWSSAIVSITLTREYAITTTLNGGTGGFYLVSGALDGPLGMSFSNSAWLGNGVTTLGTLPTRNETSGNLLLNFGDALTGLYAVNRLLTSQGDPWTVPAVQVTAGSWGQSSVSGSQIFLGDPTTMGLRVLDFSALPTVVDQGVFRTPTTGGSRATLAYGNYLLAANDLDSINVIEIAQPSGLHGIGSAPVGGAQSELTAGLLFSGNGPVLDLTSGNPPVALNGNTGLCSTDIARVGDVIVSGYDRYRVMNMEDAVDRDANATFPTFWDSSDWSDFVPAATQVTGLDAVGHVVIAAEVRTTGSSGVWLRVMDGRKLLRRATWQSFDPLGSADLLGELRISTASSTTLVAHLSMHLGRALVTLEDGAGVSGNTFFVVDLRPLFDDDAATTISAPSNIIQAQLTLGNLNGGVIRGNYAYVADATNGLRVVAIPQAMDELSATVVPSATPKVTLALPGGAEAVTVYGSYAYATPTQFSGMNKGLQVIDVRNPLAPSVFSFLPLGGPNNQCGARGAIHISGSRAYSTGAFQTQIFELE